MSASNGSARDLRDRILGKATDTVEHVAARTYRAETAAMSARLKTLEHTYRERRRGRAGQPRTDEDRRAVAELDELREMLAGRAEEQQRLDSLAEIRHRVLWEPALREARVALAREAGVIYWTGIVPAIEALREAIRSYTAYFEEGSTWPFDQCPVVAGFPESQLRDGIARITAACARLPQPGAQDSMPPKPRPVLIAIRCLEDLDADDGRTFAAGTVIRTNPDVAGRLVREGLALVHAPAVEDAFMLDRDEWRERRGLDRLPPEPAPPPPPDPMARARDAAEAQRAAAASADPLGMRFGYSP